VKHKIIKDKTFSTKHKANMKGMERDNRQATLQHLQASLFVAPARHQGAASEELHWEPFDDRAGSGSDEDAWDDSALGEERYFAEEAVFERDFNGGTEFAGDGGAALRFMQPKENKMRSLDKFINLSEMNLSQSAVNDLKRGEKVQQGHNRYQGRDDRSTVEQVLDPRTRLILFKMLSRGTFEEINGCISTGKEANVYHAKANDGKCLAVKVFKTSILVFKDRDKYVNGEHRFQGNYGKKNPRKMVKLWAEKELRNLRRLHSCNIPCPEPIMLRSHVLVMEFIGTNGWPAPRLKDVVLSDKKIQSAYVQCLKILRRLFQQARLVHGDFSEYNLLYMNRSVYVIDVSQSVEMDHPRALEFLRLDIENTNNFFGRRGLAPMHLYHTFQFVVDKSFDCSDEQMDAALDKIQESLRKGDENVLNEVDTKVFLNSFIPTSLAQIDDIEREQELLDGNNDVDRKLLHVMTGLNYGNEARDGNFVHGNEDREVIGSDEEGEEDESGENAAPENPQKLQSNAFTLKDADKESRKAHKKLVKQEKAERRKSKVPKHVKKRQKQQSIVKK